jgi:hypothetical protein
VYIKKQRNKEEKKGTNYKESRREEEQSKGRY